VSFFDNAYEVSCRAGSEEVFSCNTDAPRVLRFAKLWFPRAVFILENNFGDLVCVSLYKKNVKKARVFLFGQIIGKFKPKKLG
jgi:hypothetical protein